MNEEDENPKRFDLEDRTFAFAKRVRAFIKALTKTLANIEDCPAVDSGVGINRRELH
jgi:hypothetical protein